MEDLKLEIERLRAENEALKKPARGQMHLHARDAKGSAYDFTFEVER